MAYARLTRSGGNLDFLLTNTSPEPLWQNCSVTRSIIKDDAMESFLEKALRRGVIPFCCGGASVCFALYSAKVSFAAKQWAALDVDDSIWNDSGRRFSNYASLLDQHAGSCIVLSFLSAATTYEAMQDWKGYRTLASLDKMENWLISRPVPFFLRVPVIATAIFSFIYLDRINKGSQFLLPSPRPLIIPKRKELK